MERLTITVFIYYSRVSVRLGEHDINTESDCEKSDYGDEYCSDPVQDIDVEASIPHPNYNSTDFTSDIGLIRLAQKINTSVGKEHLSNSTGSNYICS